jgi:TonB family protein
MSSMIAACFFIFSCHDQVMNDLTKSTLTQTDHYPPEVKSDMDAYIKKNPDAKLSYIEGRAAEIEKLASTSHATLFVVKTYDLSGDGMDKKGVLLSNITDHAEALQTEGKVFTVVEQVASFEGGFPALLEHLRQNVLYPSEAREAGAEGTVYVEFIVNEDGTLSDHKVLKGVHPALDAEAVRAIKTLPNWTPGKQNGVAVKQRYVLPIAFAFNTSTQNKVEPIVDKPYKMDVNMERTDRKGKSIVTGVVLSHETGKPLAGTNVIIVGTSTGTTTDANGKFSIEVPAENGQLVFSFVGYDFERVDF